MSETKHETISELIHALFWPQYSTGRRSILKPVTHLGLLLSDNLESYNNLMVPVAFALVDCDSLCSAAFHQPNWPPLLYPVAP